jgi:hypothetical protein
VTLSDFGPIALVDVYDGGHHRSYMNMYAMALAEENVEVYSLSTFPLTISENLKSLIHHIPLPKHLGDDTSILGLIAFLRDIVGRLKNVQDLRFVFFMYTSFPAFNGLPGWMLDLLLPYSWGALNMHPVLGKTERSLAQKLRIRLFGERGISERYIKSRRMKCLAFLSELAVERYSTVFPKKTFVWLPDVADNHPAPTASEIATQITRRGKGRKIVTLVGSLGYRKGINLFMHLAMTADQSKYYFALCGEPAWHTFPDRGRLFKQFVSRADENCFFHLKYIEDDNEFDGVLAASDIIFNAMVGFQFSSNILYKAAVMKKPIIVTDRGVCGLRAMKYRLGAIIPENDVYSALRALDMLSGESWKGEWKQFEADFSVERLRHLLGKMLSSISS